VYIKGRNCRGSHMIKELINTTRNNIERRHTSQRASAENGVSSEGFSTTVHPAAIAGAAFLVSIAIGKFHCKQHTNVQINTRIYYFKTIRVRTIV